MCVLVGGWVGRRNIRGQLESGEQGIYNVWLILVSYTQAALSQGGVGLSQKEEGVLVFWRPTRHMCFRCWNNTDTTTLVIRHSCLATTP
uniref:Uncharacterized protein n=1 Tax=Octopus bimaculoides TaxID=37653 RepID=A0A0L8HLR9_OCTBM